MRPIYGKRARTAGVLKSGVATFVILKVRNDTSIILEVEYARSLTEGFTEASEVCCPTSHRKRYTSFLME